MYFLPKKIDDYIIKHSDKEPDLLKELTKETQQKVLNSRMLSSAFQGRVLSMISKLIAPKSILEIGTYTGYSALCLAEGLQAEGILHTIDKNKELKELQTKYFHRSVFKNKIKQYMGNAVEIIPQLNDKFDLVFIDADKHNYPNYFNLIINKVNTGGVILSDNVLWSGKVIEPLNVKDIDTKMLLAYNKLLCEDDRVETVILPIRDGLTISRVK